MIEIRFHGRGGQGAVIASKILAQAIFEEGNFVQAFPSFGVERRGAPVTAFVRADKERINLRTQIYTPDHIIIMDPTLINYVNVFEGLKPGGTVLINTSEPLEKFEEISKKFKVAVVDANHIAARHKLGSPSYPIINTTILGALVKFIGVCSLESLTKAIKEGVPIKPESNANAAIDAYSEVKF